MFFIQGIKNQAEGAYSERDCAPHSLDLPARPGDGCLAVGRTVVVVATVRDAACARCEATRLAALARGSFHPGAFGKRKPHAER